MEYHDRYVYNPSSSGSVPSTGYETWFRDMYGPTGLTQFWQGSAKLIACDNKVGKELVTCIVGNIGMIPILGEAADAVNGVIYLVDGQYGEALLSLGSMVPIVGAFVPGAKKALPAFKKVKQIYKNNPCGCLP
ncbi:hypothetical protein [Paenibacillus sp. DS2015]|uniref:hypothetical protein n=1 Tax=Paenibacillus sp. DS2015 TaxID=3373917 RepID=UPI003D257E03